MHAVPCSARTWLLRRALTSFVPRQPHLQSTAHHARPALARLAATSASAESNASASTSSPVTSAYIHLPFCRRRCYYCDFAISVVGDNVASPAVRDGMERYVDDVCEEISLTPVVGGGGDRGSTAASTRLAPLRTIFFGGGTPSLVPPPLLGRLLDALRTRFGIAPDAEVSMEMDPGTFDAATLEAYLALGVNRVSLGVQSFEPSVLKSAGRAHSADDARAAVGFMQAAQQQQQNNNISSPVTVSRAPPLRWSIDLISGLPGLDTETWGRTLALAADANPDHVSVYDLQVEPGTPFGRWYSPGSSPLPR